MRCGINSARNHAIGVIFINHHGTKIRGIGHAISGLFFGNAFGFTHFIICLHIIVKIWRKIRLNNTRLGHIKAQFRNAFTYAIRIAKQNYFCNIST